MIKAYQVVGILRCARVGDSERIEFRVTHDEPEPSVREPVATNYEFGGVELSHGEVPSWHIGQCRWFSQ